MKRVVPRLACALAAGAMLACGGGDEEAGIDRDRFVAAYLDLREATVAGALDSTSRDSILAGHGVTAEEMRAFLSSNAADPEALARAWQDVMDSVAARDTAGQSEAEDADDVDPDADD